LVTSMAEKIGSHFHINKLTETTLKCEVAGALNCYKNNEADVATKMSCGARIVHL